MGVGRAGGGPKYASAALLRRDEPGGILIQPAARARVRVAGGTAEETLANLQPKKPHWDLQRDVQGRLDKLERRTQRAIVELMQAEERAKLAP